MSSPDFVALRRTSDSTAVVTLARPERRNAINPQMATEITEALAVVVGWGVQVVTIDAEGPAFCAGVDLADLDAGGTALDSLVEELWTVPVHLTAAVQGPAMGAALAILAPCPRVLSGTSAVFGLPELGKGFFPVGLMADQVDRVGARRAFELAFSAAPVSAEEAMRIGLVTEVVADEGLVERAETLATALGSVSPEGLRAGISSWQSSAHRRDTVLK